MRSILCTTFTKYDFVCTCNCCLTEESARAWRKLSLVIEAKLASAISILHGAENGVSTMCTCKLTGYINVQNNAQYK